LGASHQGVQNGFALELDGEEVVALERVAATDPNLGALSGRGHQ
jgi:hypothetical protein